MNYKSITQNKLLSLKQNNNFKTCSGGCGLRMLGSVEMYPVVGFYISDVELLDSVITLLIS
jgi:hypothetical protein